MYFENNSVISGRPKYLERALNFIPNYKWCNELYNVTYSFVDAIGDDVINYIALKIWDKQLLYN